MKATLTFPDDFDIEPKEVLVGDYFREEESEVSKSFKDIRPKPTVEVVSSPMSVVKFLKNWEKLIKLTTKKYENKTS